MLKKPIFIGLLQALAFGINLAVINSADLKAKTLHYLNSSFYVWLAMKE